MQTIREAIRLPTKQAGEHFSMMFVSNRSVALCALFVLINANSACAKTLRNAERKLGARKLMFGADVANAELDNQWENFAVQQQMSIPTTMAPVAPTAPPTAPPTTEGETAPPTVPATPNPTTAPNPDPTPPPTSPPTPPPTPSPTTPPPTGPVSLFLDEDDVFDEFSLAQCQGGKSNQ